MFIYREYPDDLWRDIFLCDEGRRACHEKCPDQIGDEESFIFLFEPGKCPCTEAFLTDISFEFMLSDRHEWYLSTSKESKSKNEKEKD